MTDHLGVLGGNVYPTTQLVISQAQTGTEPIHSSSTLYLNPPVPVPSNSNISIQGVLQISTGVTLKSPWSIKLKVLPWLADVQANKTHVAPACPAQCPTDSAHKPCDPTFGYNPVVGLSMGTFEHQAQWRLGNIVPHSINSKLPQLAGNPMNTLSDYRRPSVWMCLQTSANDVKYSWPALLNVEAGCPYVASLYVKDMILALAQPTYVPYPTASNLTLVSNRDYMPSGVAPTMNDQPAGFDPYQGVGPPLAGLGYVSGPTGLAPTNNFYNYMLWSTYDAGVAGFNMQNSTGSWIDSMENFYARGSLTTGWSSICVNNIIPSSSWCIKPLVRMGNEPTTLTVLDLGYHDIMSCSPYAKVSQASMWAKPPFSQPTITSTLGISAPGWSPQCTGVLRSGDPTSSDSLNSVAPLVQCSQRNTTIADNPMNDEFHITQFGAIIPWDWQASGNYQTPATRHQFQIKNDLSSFNALTETESSRQLSFNLGTMVKQLHHFSSSGRVNAISSLLDSFAAPPSAIHPRWNESFVLQPGSFFCPFIGQNDQLLTTKSLERADLTGNQYDSRYLKNTIGTQDPLTNSGNVEQSQRRPTPQTESFHDNYVVVNTLSNPTSIFRLPQINYARPTSSVLLGQGQAVPYNDQTMPPIRPYGWQTYFSTIMLGSGLFHESGIPAMGLAEHAVDALGINQNYALMNACASFYWNTYDFNSNATIELYPFTWWGHLSRLVNTYYQGGTTASNDFASYLPFLTTTINQNSQAGFVQKGQSCFSWNTTTSPWGVLPTFPMTSLMDIAAAPVSKGVPHHATMQPLSWFIPSDTTPLSGLTAFNLADEHLDYKNIGYTSNGVISSMTSTGETETLEQPNAGRYHVAGRHIVLGNRAYGFVFDQVQMGYYTPFTVTATITIPVGRYSFASIGNMITQALNDPSSPIMKLTCSIPDDDGNDTPIGGCLNAIEFDPMLHNVVWTCASSKADSMSLPLPTNVKALMRLLSSATPIMSSMTNESLISAIMPTSWSTTGSRAITAFRASQAARLQSNMSFNWLDGNYSITGCSYPLYPTGGSGSGISDLSTPVATYSSGFYTRTTNCLQAIGSVVGITTGQNGNTNNAACYASDPIFIQNCLPFGYDIVLNDGAYGPVFPNKEMTGACDWSAVTMSLFTTVERSDFNGCSITMSGTMLPTNINGTPYWGPAFLQTFLRLGSHAWLSKFNGPASYLHKSPIINPIRSCVCAGLTGNQIIEIAGVSDADQVLIGKVLGMPAPYSTKFSQFYVSFSEGLREVFDCVTKSKRTIYHPDNFCYMSPHPLDSDIFTSGPDVLPPNYLDTLTPDPSLVQGSQIVQTSFSPGGGSHGYLYTPQYASAENLGLFFQGYAWQGNLPPAGSGDLAPSCPRYNALQGYRPYTCNNRFLDLSSIGEVVNPELFTVKGSYLDSSEPIYGPRPSNALSGLWLLSPYASGDLAPSKAAPGVITIEHALCASLFHDLQAFFPIDITPLPALHPISCCVPFLSGPMNDFYNQGDTHLSITSNLNYSPIGSLGGLSIQSGFTRPFRSSSARSTYVPDYLQTFNALIRNYWIADPNSSNVWPVQSSNVMPNWSSYLNWGPAPNTLDPNGYQAITNYATMVGRNTTAGLLHKNSPVIAANLTNIGYPGSPPSNQPPIAGDFVFRYSHPLLPVQQFSPLTTPGWATYTPSADGVTIPALGSVYPASISGLVTGLRSTPDQPGSSWMYQNGFTGGLNGALFMLYQTDIGCGNVAPVDQWSGTLGNALSVQFLGLNDGWNQDPVSCVCNSSSSNLSLQPRSFYTKLPRNCSQGPCYDADGCWFFNTFNPGCFFRGLPIKQSQCLPNPNHPVYTTPHSNFTFHAYRSMQFGCLQQGRVPCIVEEDMFSPPLKGCLGWLGFTKAFYQPTTSVTEYSAWDHNSDATVVWSPDMQTRYHYVNNGLESTPTFLNPSGVITRYFFPLAYTPTQHFLTQKLLPLRADAFIFSSAGSITQGCFRGLQANTIVSFPLRTNAGVGAFNHWRMVGPTANPVQYYGPPVFLPGQSGGVCNGRQACVLLSPLDQPGAMYCPPLGLTTPAYVSPFLLFNQLVTPGEFETPIRVGLPFYGCMALSNTSPTQTSGIQESQIVDPLHPATPASLLQAQSNFTAWSSAQDRRCVINSIGYYNLSQTSWSNSFYCPGQPNNIPVPPTSAIDMYNGAWNTFQSAAPSPGIAYIGANRIDPTLTPTQGPSWQVTNPLTVTQLSAPAGVFVPEPVQCHFIYPQPGDLPWTEYYMQVPPSPDSLSDIQMSFAPLAIEQFPLTAFIKTPWISMTLGGGHYNSTMYSSMGIFGTPSTFIAKALGYIPNNLHYGPPSAKGYVTARPAYKNPTKWTVNDLHAHHYYRNTYQIGRRLSFIDVIDQDPVSFSVPKIPTSYSSDTPYSGPCLNFNDNIPVDVNPRIYPNPAFTPFNLPPTVGLTYGDILMVSVTTIPSIYSLRCDVRLNHQDDSTATTRLLSKQVVVPQSNPQEVPQLATYSYSLTMPPPLESHELVSLTLSLTDRYGEPIDGLYSHNATVIITPSVTAPDLVGYGISAGETANLTIPRLTY